MNSKPYPGMGAYVLVLNYGGTWVAHKGAQTQEPLLAERRRLAQWPDHLIKIVPNTHD